MHRDDIIRLSRSACGVHRCGTFHPGDLKDVTVQQSISTKTLVSIVTVK